MERFFLGRFVCARLKRRQIVATVTARAQLCCVLCSILHSPKIYLNLGRKTEPVIVKAGADATLYSK